MHDDLQAVLSLWERDRATLAIEERLAALDEAIRAAAERLEQIARQRAELEARRAALNEEERVLQKRLTDVSTRRIRTRELIDSGRATDYLVATRQVESMATQQDELETRILEILEEVEGIDAGLAGLERSTTLGVARHREALADRERELPLHNAELARLAAERAPRWERLIRDEQNRYRNLRLRNQVPIALLVEDTCASCRRSVPPQTVNEIHRGAKVHHCLSCLRWLVEPSFVSED